MQRSDVFGPPPLIGWAKRIEPTVPLQRQLQVVAEVRRKRSHAYRVWCQQGKMTEAQARIGLLEIKAVFETMRRLAAAPKDVQYQVFRSGL
jgi:hypothetical protein